MNYYLNGVGIHQDMLNTLVALRADIVCDSAILTDVEKGKIEIIDYLIEQVKKNYNDRK